MSLLNKIYLAQRNAGEDAVIANLERMGLVQPRQTPQHDLLGRCLSVISTLEGEDTDEQGLLDELQHDIKQVMGITPLVPGSLI
ncbi:hypothetical protein [Rhodoferax antarcticus]|uniref:Uncharacterized protein n=1 Tax=Rhodoferax antarcticus ANT.BR TaxID=1111071 RepID=A0A1Q8Y8Y8_9BURK|nr:hypothetical protein [Rhodoferax antarcticus]OLP04516.1 hypothetical protein BLL52_4284 [Rhodoferax antarcticus ANT.BR]